MSNNLILVLLAGAATLSLTQRTHAQLQPASPAIAQPDSQPPAYVVLPTSEVFRESVHAPSLAREFRRLALLELRAVQIPSQDDYVCTEFLLDLAFACQDPTPEQLRQRIEAAFNAGDAAAVERETRRLLTLVPTDTVAQMRLISSRIATMQTAEDRLAAYDRVLGKDGEKLDAGVRSRLALDASLLAKELGDREGFARRLRLAAQLDGTNKDAALLLYQFFAESSTDPVGSFELLVNLLYADPLDPAVHFMIRDALLAAHVFPAARRFQQGAERIIGATMIGMDESAMNRRNIESFLISWRADGPSKLLSNLEAQLRETKESVAAAIAAGGESDSKLDDARLTYDLEEIRLAAAIASVNPAIVDASLAELSSMVESTARNLADPALRSVSPEVAAELTRGAIRSLVVWRAVANRNLGAMEAELKALEERCPNGESELPLAQAWVRFRTGDIAAAESLLSQASPSIWGALLAGEIANAKGDQATAVKLLVDLSDYKPLDPVGALAFERAAQIDSSVRAQTPQARDISALAAAVPAWIDTMVTEPRLHQQLSAVAEYSKPGFPAMPFEPVYVNVTLTNLSRMPLGLGANRALNSRLAFIPALETRGGIINTAEAEIFEFAGATRLLPQQSVTVRCEPDLGVTGWLASAWCTHPTRIRWRVIQGFEPERGNNLTTGPGCLETSLTTIPRQSVNETVLRERTLVESITDAGKGEGSWQALLYSARALMMQLAAQIEPGVEPPPLPEVIARAVATRYPTLSPAARAMTLCVMPPAAQIPDLRVLDEVARTDTDPRLRALYLLTRAADPNDAVFQLCLNSEDPQIKRIAAIQQKRLSEGRVVYSVSGVTASPKGN
jgi:hypothetical protein